MQYMCSSLEEGSSRWGNGNCRSSEVGMKWQKLLMDGRSWLSPFPMTDKEPFKATLTWFNLIANSPFCLFNFSPSPQPHLCACIYTYINILLKVISLLCQFLGVLWYRIERLRRNKELEWQEENVYALPGRQHWRLQTQILTEAKGNINWVLQVGCNAMKSHGCNCDIPYINRSAAAQLENIIGMHNASSVLPYTPIFQER